MIPTPFEKHYLYCSKPNFPMEGLTVQVYREIYLMMVKRFLIRPKSYTSNL